MKSRLANSLTIKTQQSASDIWHLGLGNFNFNSQIDDLGFHKLSLIHSKMELIIDGAEIALKEVM